MPSIKKPQRSKRRRATGLKMSLRAQAFMAADLLDEDAEQWHRDLLSARRLKRQVQAAMTASKAGTAKRRRGL